MYISILIFLVTYILIATERVDKTIAALLGAACVVIFQAAPYEELLLRIDLNVIFLLVGMMIIVNILATTGVFEWVAISIAQKTKGDGKKIIILLMLVTALFSAFLDNVTTIILIAPVTILITQILEIPTVPILIAEAIFSNIGGTATLVGDPPNILIGSQAELTFNAFLINLAPIILIIIAILLLFMHIAMKRLSIVSTAAKERIRKANPAAAIIEPQVLKKALVVFGLVLVGFFLGRLINVEPGIVAMAGAALMAMVCKADIHHVIQKVEWATILFFIGLFMLIGALEVNGIFNILGNFVLAMTNGNLLLTVIAILWFSAIASAIVDNIPLVIGMIPLIKSIIPAFASQMHLQAQDAIQAQIGEPLFWALALGACLGGNGSLVGASANVVIAQIARRNKYKLTFADFTRYGLPTMLVTLLICTIYMYLRYF